MPRSTTVPAFLWLREQQRRRKAAALEERLQDRRVWQERRKKLLAVLAEVQAASAKQPRREVKRNDGGWSASTIAAYLRDGDEDTYKLNFRCTKQTFRFMLDKLTASGYCYGAHKADAS